MKSKQYNGLDLCKLIAAIMVLLIHSIGYQYTELRSILVDTICCMAVPFFFIASGFFFSKILSAADGQGLKSNQSQFRVYIVRLLKMYVFWSVVSLPVDIYSLALTFPKQYGHWILRLLRSFFLTGSCGIYWYFLSLICASLVLYVLIAAGRKKLLYFIAATGFCLGIVWDLLGENTGYVLLDIPFSIANVLFGSSRNFIMQGIPYMAIGYWLSKHRLWSSVYTSIFILLLACLLKYLENRFGRNTGLFQLFQAIALFQLGRTIDLPRSAKLARRIRELSTAIYCVQVLFLLPFDIYLQNPWYLNTSLALFVCIAVYFLVYFINNPWLCSMFNMQFTQKEGAK